MKRLTVFVLSIIFALLVLCACNDTETALPENSTEVISAEESDADQTESTSSEDKKLAFVQGASSEEPIDYPVIDLPTLEERINEEYLRSTSGGRELSAEALSSMSSDELFETVFRPAFKMFEQFVGLGDMDGDTEVYFRDEAFDRLQMHYDTVSDKRFPTYEAFVGETRKYFSRDITVDLFSDGFFFELDGVFYGYISGARGASIDYYKTEFEVTSVSETEIKILGTARHFKSEDDKNVWHKDPTFVFDDTCFEFDYHEYTLSLEEGKWVFTEFELPY